ncbi:hypothetical protein ES703_87696 [subsurface metagenome]
MNTQVTQTPVELIEYLKTIERTTLPTYIERRGTTAGHDWILIGANQAELDKLGFSPAFWTTLTQLWVAPGRAHLDLIELVGYITEGLDTQLEKARRIAEWVYKYVEYVINTEAPPWELVKPGVTGDCSSFTPLVCALLGIAGIKCWGKQTAFWQEPRYSHMYALALLPDGWYVIDPTAKPVMSREVAGISSYGLFEVDETFGNIPPVTGPDQQTVFPPLPSWDEFKKMLPWLGVMGLGLGLVVTVGRK